MRIILDFGEIPLFYAYSNGSESIVECLIEHGKDVNKTKRKGETPLFKSCKSGNVKYNLSKIFS